MSYLTLTEAAAYASRVKGFTVEPASLLRAGIHGHLLIVASFNGLMRNLSGHTNDDYVGLLVLAPSELLTIETEGQARITGAFGLDGKAAYSPQVIRTMAQLRVRVPDLDKFLPSLIPLDTQPQATPEPASVLEAPASEPKAKRTTAFNDVLHYLQEVHRNGKFKTTDVFIRELVKQSGEVDSPFKKATRTDDTFYLKSGGKSVSHSVISDKMKYVR